MQSVEEQYKKTENLKSRIGIYEYSTASMSLHEWMSSLIPGQKNIKILELGCGTGILWKSLKHNFTDCRIILSDMSENMLRESQKNLQGLSISYEKIDFNSIPYSDNSFDLIISNHNLYHAENTDLVLSEIVRVLKDKGTFICSTNSRNHLTELKELLGKYGISSIWPNLDLTEKFGMENGETVLSPFFSTVNDFTYKNKLHITEPEAVISYFLSVRNEITNKMIDTEKENITREIRTRIEAENYYEVQTEAGMFICHK